jgi:hypothetical protein
MICMNILGIHIYISRMFNPNIQKIYSFLWILSSSLSWNHRNLPSPFRSLEDWTFSKSPPRVVFYVCRAHCAYCAYCACYICCAIFAGNAFGHHMNSLAKNMSLWNHRKAPNHKTQYPLEYIAVLWLMFVWVIFNHAAWKHFALSYESVVIFLQ